MAKTSSPTTKRRRPVAVHVKKGPALGNYAGALKFLLDRPDIERLRPTRQTADLLKLNRMRNLLDRLGNPHQAVRMVHIGGTKGKGSTCEMTASCLQACGYTVGIYTSPHLVDIRERIRINRRQINHPDFTHLAQKVADAAANLSTRDGEPTFFELVTAMSFLHFAEEAVDVAVIEVGLGGRLDSTNVISPEVSAVTSISLDHTQILGETVEKIAREKAGIFKPGAPAITVEQKPSVLETLREAAERAKAPFYVVGQDIEFSYRFEATGGLGPHARVCLSSSRNNYEHLPVPLKGEHQAMNCGLALAILDKLSERGFSTPEAKVTAGLARTECPGRMELAWNSPRILLDGAHNTDSIRCLMKAIGATIPCESMVVVFGCAADKDVNGMLGQLSQGADKVIFTRSSATGRAADPRELARRFMESHGKMAQVADDLPTALNLAARAVQRDDLVCVTGSFYLVGDAKKHFAGLKEKKAVAAAE